jgi:hypothetical protein
METPDTCCTFFPSRKDEGKSDEIKALRERFVEKTRGETKMFYGFSFADDEMHCREGYQDADGVLAHIENVGELFKEAFKIANLTRLAGPKNEIEKLRALAESKPQFLHAEIRLSAKLRRQESIALKAPEAGEQSHPA